MDHVTIKRHFYHTEGLTDMSVMRSEAIRAGEPAVLHLHPYDEPNDGCPYVNLPGAALKEIPGHELYQRDEATA